MGAEWVLQALVVCFNCWVHHLRAMSFQVNGNIGQWISCSLGLLHILGDWGFGMSFPMQSNLDVAWSGRKSGVLNNCPSNLLAQLACEGFFACHDPWLF